MWFNSWADVGRALVIGTIALAAVLLLVRAVGNRTIATMNASDFILTVAMGSTVASMMTSASVPVAQGVAALATLVGLQAFTLWLSIRMPALRRRTQGAPVLLLHRGQPLEAAMKRVLVSGVELRQVARQEGFSSFDDIEAIILEANGRFSVIGRGGQPGEPLKEVLD